MSLRDKITDLLFWFSKDAKEYRRLVKSGQITEVKTKRNWGSIWEAMPEVIIPIAYFAFLGIIVYGICCEDPGMDGGPIMAAILVIISNLFTGLVVSDLNKGNGFMEGYERGVKDTEEKLSKKDEK